MFPLRSVLAEWQVVRPRLVRSRLGLCLLLLVAGTGAGGAPPRAAAITPLALQVGMLAGVLGIAFAAGSDADRAAVALTLTHPTTPFAIALGRWLAAVTAAGIALVVTIVAAAGLHPAGGLEVVRAGVVGLVAAGAAAAAALPGAWLGGNTATGILFIYIAATGVLAPEGTGALRGSGPLRLVASAVLQVAPCSWRYQGLTLGSGTAWLHALVWMVGGVSLSALLLERRGV